MRIFFKKIYVIRFFFVYLPKILVKYGKNYCRKYEAHNGAPLL